jgi:rhodanese-related sulfurtransferase/polyisoprenoid-binding protein YceI
MSKPAQQISREDLASQLSSPAPPLVIDVRLEEEYQTAHVPGAKNACVFKITFIDDVKKLAVEPSKPLVVYGSSSRDLASATAAEKLMAAGYKQVSDYGGGLEDWRAGGGPTEGTGAAARGVSRLRDGSHQLNLETSRLEWTGRNLTTTHHGTVKLRAGHIEVREGRPLGGAFTVDMDSLENLTIQEPKLRQVLVWHLKSDDFFDVQHFPVAELQLSKITALPNARPGSPNYQINGTLTLKGVSGEVAFPAILAPGADGLLAADAHFDIDRTRWNVLYGSGKFYEKLGMHLVNDEISLALKLKFLA